MSELMIDPAAAPSGAGCVECDDVDGWWVHLRRCTACGHIGCCDSSLGKHATAHWKATGHRVMQSYEPGEDWMWDFETQAGVEPVELAPPTSHPDSQPAPGPKGRVPLNWRALMDAAAGE